ncbi:hypothetical protein [Thermosediminibacter litoriperuensis]|uniref:Uncharacterized protein n=1 Tax=Thermosediminibacter litoriperuensis TaxID=291989 RepID=A0A5S5ALG1_9FIRM|nr:hypothetical protein [Thermosediminibacter litoriperuensis]TYP51652.1 hypothetical protein LZ11_01775 [Thermosediminibacter litoriperuensis]
MVLLGFAAALGVVIVVFYFFLRKLFINKKGCIKEPQEKKKEPEKPAPGQEEPVGVPEPQKPKQPEGQQPEQPQSPQLEQPEGEKSEQQEGQKPEQPEDKKPDQGAPVGPVPDDKANNGTGTPEV